MGVYFADTCAQLYLRTLFSSFLSPLPPVGPGRVRTVLFLRRSGVLGRFRPGPGWLYVINFHVAARPDRCPRSKRPSEPYDTISVELSRSSKVLDCGRNTRKPVRHRSGSVCAGDCLGLVSSGLGADLGRKSTIPFGFFKVFGALLAQPSYRVLGPWMSPNHVNPKDS